MKKDNKMKKPFYASDNKPIQIALIIYIELNLKNDFIVSSDQSPTLIKKQEQNQVDLPSNPNLPTVKNSDFCDSVIISENIILDQHNTNDTKFHVEEESLNFNSGKLFKSSFCETSQEHDASLSNIVQTFGNSHLESSYSEENLLSFRTTELTGLETRYVIKSNQEHEEKYLQGCPVTFETTTNNAPNSQVVLSLNHEMIIYPLIRNDNQLQPKKFNEISCKYGDTSRFDSIMEILVRVCHKNQVFRIFCFENKDANETKFLQAVFNYCNEANIHFLYKYRSQILFRDSVGTIQTNIQVSQDPIGLYFNNIMKLRSTCRKCNNEFNFDNFTVSTTIAARDQLSELPFKLQAAAKKHHCGEPIKNNHV